MAGYQPIETHGTAMSLLIGRLHCSVHAKACKTWLVHQVLCSGKLTPVGKDCLTAYGHHLLPCYSVPVVKRRNAAHAACSLAPPHPNYTIYQKITGTNLVTGECS